MRAEQHQRLEQRQQLVLSQIQIQKLEILQLPVLELRDLVTQELEVNPVLELREEEPEEPTVYEDRKDASMGRELERIDEIEREWENLERKPWSEEDDKKYEFMQNISGAHTDIRGYLLDQLMLMEVPDDVRVLVEQLINNVVDSGYLTVPLEDIVPLLPAQFDTLNTEQKLERLDSALKILQSMEPKGVGARNIKECLLIQLPVDSDHYDIKKLLIEEHLDGILSNKLPKLAKALLLNDSFRTEFNIYGRDTTKAIDVLKQIVQDLSRLNPKPGNDFSTRKAPQVVPEIIVKDVEGRLELVVNDSYVPPICVSQNYLELLKSKTVDAKDKAFVRKKVELAKGLISALDHRRRTLRNIAMKVLDHQRDFFEKGIAYLKPLTMQQVADEVGIHISTVSRAANSKFMQTPDGIYPLGFFFATAATRHHAVNAGPFLGESKSRLSILNKLSEIVSEENKTRPLSDSEIANMLMKEGIKVARRTVAKYRESVNIPPADQRKQY